MSNAVRASNPDGKTRGIAIIALGNRFRGDDGVAIEIAEGLGPLPPGCTLSKNPGDALALLDTWEDAALAIVLDAAMSGAPPGTIHHFGSGREAIPKNLGRCSSHGFGLAEAIALAEALGRLPSRLSIYAVEAGQFEPGAGLSAEISAAAGKVVRQVREELRQYGAACNKAGSARELPANDLR